MSWYITVLKKYAVFKGRARRKEYWMFVLFYIIFAIVALILDFMLGTVNEEAGTGLFYTIYVLAMLLPSLAVLVRRLHDTGRSGWWFFITFIPLIGSIWLLILTLGDSQPGENKYGPNPKVTTEALTTSSV